MNPLNPWVALTEICLLLALAFGAGWLVAMLRYQKPIDTTKQRIENLQKPSGNKVPGSGGAPRSHDSYYASVRPQRDF